MFYMGFENEYKNEDETNNGLCIFRKNKNKIEINLSEINNKYNFKIHMHIDKDI